MRISASNAQHIGRRPQQQDALGFTDLHDEHFIGHGGVLAVVCDGMGGMERGGEASSIALRTFVAGYERKAPERPIPFALGDALMEAHRAVQAFAEEQGQMGAVGTTLVAAVVHLSRLHWVSVGDSRIYLFRAGQLVQLTRDHVYAAALDQAVVQARLDPTELAQVARPDALTSHLGMADDLQVDTSGQSPRTLEEGDRILLCSDGVHGVLNERTISACIAEGGEHAAVRLVEAVLVRNVTNQDNLSAVVLNCEPEGTPVAPKSEAPRPARGQGGEQAMGGLSAPLADPSQRSTYVAIGVLVAALASVCVLLLLPREKPAAAPEVGSGRLPENVGETLPEETLPEETLPEETPTGPTPRGAPTVSGEATLRRPVEDAAGPGAPRSGAERAEAAVGVVDGPDDGAPGRERAMGPDGGAAEEPGRQKRPEPERSGGRGRGRHGTRRNGNTKQTGGRKTAGGLEEDDVSAKLATDMGEITPARESPSEGE